MIHEDLLEWLDDESAEKCILVEAEVNTGWSETTLYFATSQYLTGPSSTPANTIYMPLISGVSAVSESLSLTGGASLTFGEITLDNSESELNDLLMYICTNRAITVLIGSPSWDRADFRVIYKGVIEDIVPKGVSEFSITMTDSLERLNGPVSQEIVESRDNAFSPVSFGEVCNVKPLLIDPALLLYSVHTEKIGGIIEVRDAGAPVLFRDNTDGTFTLLASPYGEIACSVHGDAVNGYTDTISGIIQNLATHYGPDATFTLDDIDAASFAAFETNNQQTVGVYQSSRTNLLSTLKQLSGSVGAAVAASKLGKLRIHQLTDPALQTSVMTVHPGEILEGSMVITQKVNPLPAIKLGYNKNYSPDGTLVAGLPDADKAYLLEDWKYAQKTNTALATLYKGFEEPEVTDSALQVGSEAEAEAARRMSLFSVPRFIVSFTGFTPLLCLELGDVITLSTTPIQAGAPKKGLVIDVASDWLNGTATIRVLI